MLPHPRALPALAALLLAVGVALAGAAPASAHARFLGADPEEGSTVAALPTVVVMTYNEEISPQFVDTAVVPPGGEPVVVDSAVDGVDLSVPVGDDPALAALATDPSSAGEWQVVARVVSVDGHPVEHTTEFVLPPEAVAAPAPTDAATTEGLEAPVAGTTAVPTGQPQEEPPASPEPGADTATTDAAPGGTAAATAAEPTEPLAGATGRLPGWVVALAAVALLVAAAAAVVVKLRRPGPGDGGPVDG